MESPVRRFCFLARRMEEITLPETNSLSLKIGIPKIKVYRSPNHPFSGAVLVSGKNRGICNTTWKVGGYEKKTPNLGVAETAIDPFTTG